ncbi:helix-turn-helix domain-containing protein [Micromonospora sp. NPDC050397]|uniref:helix-turn-helix domain-containing protein n=1 Tax=Micromonospora sp. NPDC050397 TaxID=3364279 RepID=UPI00384ECB6B
MSNESLARQLGRLLRAEREAAGFTQARFAARAGVSQQCVSHFERGTSAPTTTLVERLFGALGKQLRLDVEERDADLDAAMDAVAGRGDVTAYRDDDGTEVEVDDVDDRIWELGVLHRWAPPELTYLVDGELAAVLQGVPIRPTRLDLALAEDDLALLDEWIRAIPNCLRWVERWRDFGGYDISPLRPGPLRWMTPYGELRVRLLPGVPTGVAVTASGRLLSVRPLIEVERDEPQIARIATRARTRAASGVRSD